MTKETKDKIDQGFNTFIKIISLVSIGGLVSLGIAWGTSQQRIVNNAQKIDKVEKKTDAIDMRLTDVERMVYKIDERLQAIKEGQENMNRDNKAEHAEIKSYLKELNSKNQ